MGNIQCSQLAAMGATMTTTMTVEATGAYLRQLAAEHGSAATQLGTLFVRVTRHGNDWALEFSDDKPIDNRVLDEWSTAVGVVPGTGYGSNNAQHTEVRLTWTGTEDAAPEGTPAFYLGGAR
jgi:hypothetical protein